MSTMRPVLLAAAILWWQAPHAAQPAGPPAGAVFVMTNHNNTHPATPPGAPPNQVGMFLRGPDGTLSPVGFFDTGGQGSGPSTTAAGNSLGASGSLLLSHDARWLFVANAGTHDVAVFRVHAGWPPDGSDRPGLVRTDLVDSGGVFPSSIAYHKRLVYVLNAGGEGSITGFRLSEHGTLEPIAGSTRMLRANQDRVRPNVLTSPAQVSFMPDGRQLLVTIKDGSSPGVDPTGPGRVMVFGIDQAGLPSEDFVQTDMNQTGPFGFTFDRHGNLLVALVMGAPDGGAVGSFAIQPGGTLESITAAIPSGTSDSCWIENNGRYAYASSYRDGRVSSYIVGPDGLTLLASAAGEARDLPGDGVGKIQGATPTDLGISRNGNFLYGLLPGSGAIAGWRVGENGALQKVGEFPIVVPGIGLLDTVDGDRAPFDFGPGASPAGLAVF